MFEQPVSAEPGRIRRLVFVTLLFGVAGARGMRTMGWWSFLVVPAILLLIFGPLLIGQRLGRMKRAKPEKE
jgi:hypothetical protein